MPALDEQALRAALTRTVGACCDELARAAEPLRLSDAARADAARAFADAALDPWRPTLAIADAARRLDRLERVAVAVSDPWTIDDVHARRLRRLSATRLQGAVQNHCAALRAVAGALERLPAPLRRAERIVRLAAPGQETHNGGRAPLRVTLDRGDVLFKPVCVRNEALFALAVDAVAGRLAPLDVRCPWTVATGPGAGLVQWLAAPARELDDAQLTRFHRRLGALIALAYALNATDLHLDNVLAVGEHPVLIDLEMLLYRFPAALGPSDVTFSGLVERPSDAVPLSGSQGGGEVPTLGMWRRSRALHYRQPVAHLANRPLDTQGRPVAVGAHAGEVLEGFDHAYRAIAASRRVLLDLVERYVAERRPRTRHLLRFTAYYTLHLLRALQPADADPAEAIRRALVADESSADELPDVLIDCEVADLLRGDVPYFFTHPDGLTLEHHSGLRVPGYFRETATNALRRTLARLDRDDHAAQHRLLEVALGRQATRLAA